MSSFHFKLVEWEQLYICFVFAMDQLILGTFRGDMQKFGRKSKKNWARFRNFKIFWNWDFTSPWYTKIAITLLIFELWCYLLHAGIILLKEKIIFWKLCRKTTFWITSFFRGPRRKKVGGKEAPKTMNKI